MCVCMKIHALHDKFEVVSWMYETRRVAEDATDWPRKVFLICFFIYSCVFMCVVVILTKE